MDVIWHDERREEQVRAELLRQMRVALIEPPTAAQIAPIIRSALHQADERAVAPRSPHGSRGPRVVSAGRARRSSPT